MSRTELPPELAGIDPMSMVNKHVLVPLPTIDRPAQVMVKLTGQQPASDGDHLIASGHIWLPAVSTQGGHLIPELRFNSRLSIGNEPLASNWGLTTNDKHYRFRKAVEVAAPSWLEAAEKAGRYLLEQLATLILHLKAREERMNSPGKELYLAGLLEDHANGWETKEAPPLRGADRVRLLPGQHPAAG